MHASGGWLNKSSWGPTSERESQSHRFQTLNCLLSSVFLHHFSQLVDGNRWRRVSVAAVHRSRPQNGIVDGLLGGFDCGLEKRGQFFFAEARRQRRSRRGPLGGRAVRGRKGDDVIAAGVRAGASRPRHAQGRHAWRAAQAVASRAAHRLPRQSCMSRIARVAIHQPLTSPGGAIHELPLRPRKMLLS